jgi:alpha/beta superfamily hydrolase
LAGADKVSLPVPRVRKKPEVFLTEDIVQQPASLILSILGGFFIVCRSVNFQIQNFNLEGQLRLPDSVGGSPAVVICQQHPQYGSALDSVLVNAIGRALIAESILALSFNYRGVGRSQGSFGIGPERQEDVAAAISFVASLPEVDPNRVGIVGYSAGCAWGLAVGQTDARIKALAAISPPLSLFDFTIISGCLKPKSLINGSRDEHIPVQDFIAFCKTLVDPVEYHIIEGTDHSWQGFEKTVSEKVAHFFKQVL